jgi:trans-AT polyketide synthase/acyltransferase/oxidoreductase domain-containing protein
MPDPSSLASPLGFWAPGPTAPAFEPGALLTAAERCREACFVVVGPDGRRGVAFGGGWADEGSGRWPMLAALPGLYPEWLGDRSFTEVHHLRFPYCTGAMANGIATAEHGHRGGQASGPSAFSAPPGSCRIASRLSSTKIKAALARGESWGANLIHSPQEPAIEEAVTELYLKTGVQRIEASAFMGLTPSIVRYAYSGLWVDPQGNLQRRNHVFAKVSRPEVARRFLEPAPAELLAALVAEGPPHRRRGEAGGAPAGRRRSSPCEADSGGHTDNQALTALLPTIARLRDELAGSERGIAGRSGSAPRGLGTPGRSRRRSRSARRTCMTGSVNQACVESGLSADGRRCWRRRTSADVDDGARRRHVRAGREGPGAASAAPCSRPRASEALRAVPRHPRSRRSPRRARRALEQSTCCGPARGVWAETPDFWQKRDPARSRAPSKDPKHKMALVFRWYLGRRAAGPSTASPERSAPDYQIWCGPAMGAFNAWAAAASWRAPNVGPWSKIALNLLEGAAV